MTSAALDVTNNSNDIEIVLVEPQLPENVGAIARCMKNFGMLKLRVVKPKFQWMDERSIALAAGAEDVLMNAKIYQDFDLAIQDFTYLYACSARRRYMNKEYILSQDLKVEVKQKLVDNKIAILFGSEANGLNNEHVAMCNKILVIDNNLEFSSMNIAQAVCLVAYELFTNIWRKDLVNQQELCSKKDLECFFEDLISSLQPRGFFQVEEKQAHMIQNIKNIYTRIDKLSVTEVKTLRGILVALKRSI